MADLSLLILTLTTWFLVIRMEIDIFVRDRGQQISPIVAQTPMSGPSGTSFTQSGTGFTPNSTGTLYTKNPDLSEHFIQDVPMDENGHFEITYESAIDKEPGTYAWWVVDGGPAETKSNEVSYEITVPQPAQKIYGLFIGQHYGWEDNFRDSGLYGDLIAKEVYEKFSNLDNVEYRMLITDENKAVTQSRISAEINKIKEKIKPGDVLFIYIVGHGSNIGGDGKETTENTCDESVWLSDWPLSDKSWLTDDELTTMLSDMNDVEKWVFLDFCFSGGFWGNSNDSDIGDLEKLNRISLTAVASETKYGMYIGIPDDPDFGRTIFGIALRNGFSKKNNGKVTFDYNDDDIVTYDEINYGLNNMISLVPNWDDFNGVVVKQNELGDETIFYLDDWDPVSRTSVDFQGVLSVDSPLELSAKAGGPYLGEANTLITIDASGSSVENGDIVLYEWDLNNDGIYDISVNYPVFEHIWTDLYAGTIKLRVTDSNGATDIDSASIEVVNQPPTPLTGDYDGDGDVDGLDLSKFGIDFLNGDVDINDLIAFSENFEKTEKALNYSYLIEYFFSNQFFRYPLGRIFNGT